MDSRFTVSLTSVDMLVMNHILGPNTPLLRVEVSELYNRRADSWDRSQITVEHIIGSKISGSAQLALQVLSASHIREVPY